MGPWATIKINLFLDLGHSNVHIVLPRTILTI